MSSQTCQHPMEKQFSLWKRGWLSVCHLGSAYGSHLDFLIKWPPNHFCLCESLMTIMISQLLHRNLWCIIVLIKKFQQGECKRICLTSISMSSHRQIQVFGKGGVALVGFHGFVCELVHRHAKIPRKCNFLGEIGLFCLSVCHPGSAYGNLFHFFLLKWPPNHFCEPFMWAFYDYNSL